MENSDLKIAKIGDLISWEREDLTYEGTVCKILTNSVIVEYQDKIQGYDRTVVAHKNYNILLTD